MILVTLGTQDKSFIRLLKEIEKQINKGTITDEVIVQSGHTNYNSDNMKVFDFIPREEMEELINKSDFIITHGGVGTILSAIGKGKRIIGVPRLKKYHEHVNDHQIQLLENFSLSGYIVNVNDVDELEMALKQIKFFKPKPYKSNNKNMINTIKNYIDNI